MASYLDSLMADRERLRGALVAQIEEEAATIRELQQELEKRSLELDQKIIRLMVFRQLFGSAQQETLGAQIDVEETSKPHTLARDQLAYHQKVLQGLQEALVRLQQGGSIEPSGEVSGATKLTVADILGE